MSQENMELLRSIYADPRGLTAGSGGKVAPDAEFDLSAAYPDAADRERARRVSTLSR
jgi:hypothetical protein